MKRAMALGLAAVLSGNAQGAADVAAPLAPSGKWVVGHEDGLCTLFRDFGAPVAEAVTFGVKPISPDGFVQIVAIVPKSRLDRRSKVDQAALRTLPSGTAIPLRSERSGKTRDGGIALTVTMDRGDLPRLMTAPGIAIETKDFAASIAPTAGPKALAALTTCEDGVLKAWGIDPAMLAAIATPARGAPAEWVTTEDYPRLAEPRLSQGTSHILWRIDVDGRVSECRTLGSAGDRALDTAACAAITKNGRYSPALDKNGRPVPSWSTRRITWRLPGIVRP